MPFVFLEHITIGLDPRHTKPPVMTLTRNAIGSAAVLINPFEVGQRSGSDSWDAIR
jgi:hypothetical protein